MRARTVFALVGVLLFGCLGPALPPDVINEVAPKLSALGHPAATYQTAEAANWSNGAPEQHQKYVDLAVHYVKGPKDAPHTMNVRVYVEQEQPCKISVDVLSDDGPPPLLLDNSIASQAFGETICKAMKKP